MTRKETVSAYFKAGEGAKSLYGNRYVNWVAGCPTASIITIIIKDEYIIRHDKVCTHLHYSICKKLGIETAENW
jgi:hypothetical protein